MSRLPRKRKKWGRLLGWSYEAWKRSYNAIFDASIEKAKAEDELRQMLACILDSSLKAEKVWDLHIAYKWVRIGCIHSHNLNVESLHTLSGNE